MANLNAIRLSLVCHTCGKQFDRLKSQTKVGTSSTFCSRKCKHNAPTICCESCERIVKVKGSRKRRFCSHRCKSATLGAICKTCPTCGVEFKTSRTHSTSYCSNKCWTDRFSTELERFWSRVSRPSEQACWLWTGSTRGADGHKYGGFSSGGKTVGAHRYSWELANGTIPDGMLVCHKCDTPLCVNPSHLFIGSCKDNVQDMHAKGRARKLIGENHPMAKLSESDVSKIRAMRKDGFTLADIHKEFSPKITLATVKNAIRRGWRHSL